MSISKRERKKQNPPSRYLKQKKNLTPQNICMCPSPFQSNEHGQRKKNRRKEGERGEETPKQCTNDCFIRDSAPTCLSYFLSASRLYIGVSKGVGGGEPPSESSKMKIFDPLSPFFSFGYCTFLRFHDTVGSGIPVFISGCLTHLTFIGFFGYWGVRKYRVW